MKSVAFFNNKGGVGKTTLLCNLAGYLSLNLSKNICVVDADPQCNATQYLFDDEFVDETYSNKKRQTIHSVMTPLSLGDGYATSIPVRRSKDFGVDVVLGDPRLALIEDFFAKEWSDAKSGNVRGIKSSLAFSDLLSRLQNYDLVFFDVSPSLGAINRSILLSSDYFLSPMSIDIFSLRAFENIAEWLDDWSTDWSSAIASVKPHEKDRIPDLQYGRSVFIGYVTQQYLAKRDARGKRRAVKAYERIQHQIDAIIEASFESSELSDPPYEIGTVPNLFSLIPMSQSSHKPVFELVGKDGIVGAHFAKVKDAERIFAEVANKLLEQLGDD